MRIIVFVCAGHRLYQHFGSGPNPNWLNQQFAVQYNGKYHHISLSHSLSLFLQLTLSVLLKKMSAPVLQWNGSVTSLKSVGEIGDVTVSGQIQFSLQYHHHREELVVYVHRCQDLAQAHRNRTNP